MKTLIHLLREYAESFLALGAQGTLGFVGLAKEVTAGTAVAATDYFEIMSENVSWAIDRFPTRNAFGGFYEPDDVAGARRAAGDISMFGHPVSIGHLLKGVFNTMSHTAVLSGFLHRLNFSTTKSEFADGVPSQPYTLEIHRDVTSSHRHAYALMNRLQMSLVPNQDLRVTVGVLAQTATLLSKTTPTFPGSPTDPFTWDSASISVAGTANARFEAFNMTVNNNFDPIFTLNNSNQFARVRRRGAQEVRVGGTLDFVNVDEYLDFLNQTERQLKLNLFRSQSFNMLIDIPRFVYTAFPVGIPGRDRLSVSFEGMARYSTTSALAVDVGLTTTKSNY